MKILFYNIAYGTGLNGSWKQYLLKIWRFLFLSRNGVQKIIHLLKKANADVICLAEVDSGSFRNFFRSQTEKIRDRLRLPHSYQRSKYSPNSLWRFVPTVRKQYDAVLSRNSGEMQYHYFNNGMKKLVQEFIVNNVSIFTVHLSVLRGKVRRVQLEELVEILKKCPRPHVLCGDFNIHRGLEEVQAFLKKTRLKRIETPATYPSIKPKKHFDLFFASPELEVIDFGVLPALYSDHLPVWIQVSPLKQ